MGERRQLELDFRAVRSGLGIGEFVRSSKVLGHVDEVFRTKEHGYRRIDEFTLLHVMNFEVSEPYSLTMARADLVCIQATIAGRYSRWIGQRMDLINPHILQVSNIPLSVSDTDAGARLRGILIVCERKHFIDRYGLNIERVPPAYRPIFLSRDGTPEVLSLPLSPAGTALVDQIVSCRYGEPLRGIFVGAKTVEIICDVVSQLHGLRLRGAPRLIGEQAKLKAIETAAQIYRREIGDPPTIEQLVRRVGLNRNELTRGFRDIFGVTPHVYAHTRRMERAQELLRGGELSISEVARRVGYEGYSSFARAYHAHYGRAPSPADPGG
ncbi:helix-turn-helix transcriptional regulator [Ancylobacter sp. SL191]|uniref:helix-turn-helix transcriptional regulator n=1 Tax=Ancylobacter sp. SL191 TaxID=2995166 RepID=UPI002270CB98|nr:AraC family transcriptional regulator [Ancylobacter sp. SL191]WAC29294.1 AraC family transcriptional regulator [Ancylobacter sp. SL191]